MTSFASTQQHLVDDVVRWWLGHGPDVREGGVWTCWSNDGSELVSTDKYTWSQGRWVYLTAHLARAGHQGRLPVDGERLLALAEQSARFIRDHQLLPDGRTAYLTTTDGTVIDPGDGAHQSIFADMFVALGWGALAEITGSDEWGSRASRLLQGARAVMRSGDYRSEPYPVPAGHRSLALPMITVNVAEQVFRATGEDSVRQILIQAADEIAEHHLVGSDVLEMPGTDPASLLSRHRTPGHILELAWFLWEARDIIGEHPLTDAGRLADLAENALAIGWDNEHGGLLRYTDAHGGAPSGTTTGHVYEQLVQDTWDTKLWWPHAELLYASPLLAKVADRPALAAWHQRSRDYVAAHFIQGPGQEWVQNLNRDGSPRAGVVALPVKDPFHVARALLKLAELEREPQ